MFPFIMKAVALFKSLHHFATYPESNENRKMPLLLAGEAGKPSLPLHIFLAEPG